MAPRTYDKSTWGPGPWQTEPDLWTEVSLPFLLFAWRNYNTGAWCGYVCVPQGHPWFGIHYDEIDAQVHGGLTFSMLLEGEKPFEERHMRELPAVPYYTVGFDCGHAGDLMPAMARRLTRGDTYKDLPYVQDQIQHLLEQADAAWPEHERRLPPLLPPNAAEACARTDQAIKRFEEAK